MSAGRVIHLHLAAPAKPPVGAPCNGCGVCCALETCPAARLRFLQVAGPCPALLWSAPEACYRCGLLREPGRFFPWLPSFAIPLLRRAMARWIAAGEGCDCSAEIEAGGAA